MSIDIHPIGYIRTPYKEKFAIPRQPGQVTAARGHVVFEGKYAHPDFIRGIEQFSHLWLLFRFHQTADKEASALVRPPRLGGNQKIGVFATRSTFRPNHIGLSLVKLESVESNGLIVSGMDLLDNTPILDIKPYLPYVDSEPLAQAGYAQSPPTADMPVTFSSPAQQQLRKFGQRYPKLEVFLTQVLAQDPRPAYQKSQSEERVYGVHLYDFNVTWRVSNGVCEVLSIEPKQI